VPNNKEAYQIHKTEPRFFFGYIVVAAAFIIMMVSWAAYNSFGVFFNPLLNEFGWNRAVLSGAFSLSMFIYGVLGIVVGVINDKFGPRMVLTLCGLLLGLGYLLMSQVSTLWQIYLFYGVIIGVAMSGVWVPQLSTIARWFVKRRTLMTGIVLSGGGIGQLVGPPVIIRLIVAHNWSLSYIILGITVLLAVALAAQFLRRDPTQMRQPTHGENRRKQEKLKFEITAFSLKEVICTSQFWVAFGILFCFGFGSFAISVHIIPHAIELKISAVNAANILVARGATHILGSYILGAVADRVGNRQIFIIGFIVISGALFCLSLAGEMWMLYILIAAFGFVAGGMGASESPLTAGLFGLSSHGLIYGVVHLGFTVGASAGPLVTGYIFDLTDSYQLAFLVCAIFGIVGLILAIMLRPTKRIGGRI
jgi:MFS family permease